MKNQPGTMKNHGNQPKTMKNHETTLNCICFVSFKLFFYQIYYVLFNHNNFGRGEGSRAGINKNVTNSQTEPSVTHGGSNRPFRCLDLMSGGGQQGWGVGGE